MNEKKNIYKNLYFCYIVYTGSPLARSTVVTAIKFTIVDHPAPIDSLLKDCIGKCLHPMLHHYSSSFYSKVGTFF